MPGSFHLVSSGLNLSFTAEVPAVTTLSTSVFHQRTETFSVFHLTLRLFPANVHFSTKLYFSWLYQWHDITLRTAQCAVDPPEGEQDVIWAKPLREFRRGEAEKCCVSLLIYLQLHIERYSESLTELRKLIPDQWHIKSFHLSFICISLSEIFPELSVKTREPEFAKIGNKINLL